MGRILRYIRGRFEELEIARQNVRLSFNEKKIKANDSDKEKTMPDRDSQSRMLQS
jgi:hypothetical protein